MSIVVKNNILWVGQRDWEVRDFHGTEYKTLRGSSYNSYLIREEKNVLIDTVDHKFSREFVQNLRREIDLADLLHCQRHRLDQRPPSSSGVELPRGENRRYSRHR